MVQIWRTHQVAILRQRRPHQGLDEPQPEGEQDAQWMEVPQPSGTVEHFFVFFKENLSRCRAKLLLLDDEENTYPAAYDETPKFVGNVAAGTTPIEHYVRRIVTYLGRLQ